MSAFDIEGFKSQILSGARPNLFEVEIDGRGRESSFLVSAASLPGRSIGTASVYYRGRELKLAGDLSFAAWSTTIINDTEMTMRAYIENWMEEFIESSENKSPEGNPDGSPENYFGDLHVRQLGKEGEILREYRLIQAWPTDISEVMLSFDANDQISSFTCTWQYQRLEIVAATVSI